MRLAYAAERHAFVSDVAALARRSRRLIGACEATI